MSTIKVAICVVAKFEDYYLEEWLDYNHKLGFDKIFLYQNDWRTDVERPFLEKRICDGRSVQVPIFNVFLQERNDYDWVAFIDCDEFIVLKKHKNIKDFINDYKSKTNIIGLNWFFYGNLGIVNRETNSLLKPFTKRNANTDRHIKVIVNNRTNEQMWLPHNAVNRAMDTNGHYFEGPFNEGGPSNVAYINHYHNKTKQDWIRRCERGRVDCNLQHDINQWDNEIEINKEVEDLSAFNFMYGNNN